ncbi:MAG: class I SAM-dependent methyltransferase, partial [Flavisolibacter sp.]
MLKKKLLQAVRKMKLMQHFDKINFWLNKLKNDKRNEKFVRENPLIVLPPAYTLYEAYRIDYKSYYHDGKNTAEWLVKNFFSFIPFEKKIILDWGCGPARVVRHLPALLPATEIHGSDYNIETIEWCRQHIHSVQFSVNSLQPPLTYNENFFDAVYALSVFTHLSELNHHTWIKELHRITKPG